MMTFGLNLEGEGVEMATWIDLTKQRPESPEWTIRSREYYMVTPINKERKEDKASTATMLKSPGM